MSDTVQFALENNKSNQSSDWVNPDTGNSGGVTPVKTYSNAQGQPCREFLSTIVIGGEQQQGYGTACRQPDGSWQIVSNQPSATQTPPPAPPSNVYINNPPPVYYSYPPDFYYPYNIYLSFGYVFRGGYFLRGTYYMDGADFHIRYPIHVRERVFITPHDSGRYTRYRNWWGYKGRPDREEERHEWIRRGYERREEPREWKERDRGNKKWKRDDR